MAQDTMTLYKLIICRMLSLVNFPLSNAQISDYLLDRGYADYFDIQQSLNEMAEEALLTAETRPGTTTYELTELGRESLGYFGRRIPDVIEKDLEEYLRSNRYELRETSSVRTDYSQDPEGGYLAALSLYERGRLLCKLQMHADTEDEAARMADRFRKRHRELYETLYRELLLPDQH
ncbi:MAG: DUF4364 family protein [Lachnospiraceae bacterium]|nr:DUF4364 family protein [Lachnospiraceae bacterium]MBR0152198.1 DUF4364 family protein [Lachnospiraceae bacterium]